MSQRFEASPFSLAAFTRLSRRVSRPGVLRPGWSAIDLKARFNGLKVRGSGCAPAALIFKSTLKRASPITRRLAPALKRWSSNPSGKASEDAYLRSGLMNFKLHPYRIVGSIDTVIEPLWLMQS
jgi:hypothetical protein